MVDGWPACWRAFRTLTVAETSENLSRKVGGPTQGGWRICVGPILCASWNRPTPCPCYARATNDPKGLLGAALISKGRVQMGGTAAFPSYSANRSAIQVVPVTERRWYHMNSIRIFARRFSTFVNPPRIPGDPGSMPRLQDYPFSRQIR